MKFCGCSDLTGPDAAHGTHVARIIGAERTNHLEIMSVADHVLLMNVRTVPTGDELDKDVANAIRFVVDNGGRILNISIWKTICQERTVVDEAIKNAMERDVLIIHAAGNDNKNLDKEKLYPNRICGSYRQCQSLDRGKCLFFQNDENLKAPFSNYGQTTVDVCVRR